MKPAAAWTILVASMGAVVLSLLAPAWAVIALFGASMALLRRRRPMWWFAASSILINGAILAWSLPGTPLWPGSPLSHTGLQAGILGALRISALIAANALLLERIELATWLDGLRLPPVATGFAAALLVASQDVGRDLQRIQEARRLDGPTPPGRARFAAAADVLPALFLASWQRAQQRRDALRGAGIQVSRHFAPIVAVAALGVAGRLALLAVPNVALTYAVVFLGGTLFGARAGFWGGFWAMTLTDLMLTGLAPASFVNAPAMGLLGLLGAWLPWRGDVGDRILAASIGVVGTFLFSLTTDLATWALIPEFRTSTDLLLIRLAAGIAFNVPAALANATLFMLGIQPVVLAARAWQRPAP